MGKEFKTVSEHTPGPWTVTNADHIGDPKEDDFSYLPPYWFIDAGKGYAEDGFHIAAFMKEANARLIAAAPELLEALKLNMEGAHCQAPLFASPNYQGGKPCGKCVVCMALAAIAKAEGK
jgi:hypothetical protein